MKEERFAIDQRIVSGRAMKICVFGAGAIGGYMGVKLAQAGADVSLVARGPHLAAMQANGLTLIEEENEAAVKVNASEDPAALGVQDYVIVTLKAHSEIGRASCRERVCQ